jgi:hypothetical protein
MAIPAAQLQTIATGDEAPRVDLQVTSAWNPHEDWCFRENYEIYFQ